MRSQWITPVFCVADIPPQIINNLINALADRELKLDGRMGSDMANIHVMTSDEPLEIPKDNFIPEIAKTPFKAFKTPFTGRSIEQLCKDHERLCHEPREKSNIKVEHPFTSATFIVLDERTLRDQTCVLVTTPGRFSKARSEFALALQLLVPAEWDGQWFYDWEKESYKDPEGEDVAVYTIQGWETSGNCPYPCHYEAPSREEKERRLAESKSGKKKKQTIL